MNGQWIFLVQWDLIRQCGGGDCGWIPFVVDMIGCLPVSSPFFKIK